MAEIMFLPGCVKSRRNNYNEKKRRYYRDLMNTAESSSMSTEERETFNTESNNRQITIGVSKNLDLIVSLSPKRRTHPTNWLLKKDSGWLEGTLI